MVNMDLLTRVRLYLVSVAVFVVIDGIWLAFIAQPFYSANLGIFMAEQPNWLAAGLFYLLYLAGIQVFVLEPGFRGVGLSKIAILGGLFGLMCYATYDLTNLATIEGWPVIVTVVDLVWGTVLTATVSVTTAVISKKLGWH